jgi:hypothetical protein
MGTWTGKELIMAGGRTFRPDHTLRVFRNAAAYNPATSTWRRLPSMPRPRGGGTALWDGKEVLFIGGSRSPNASARRGMAYNPATNRWRLLPAMSSRAADSRRCGPAAGYLSGAGSSPARTPRGPYPTGRHSDHAHRDTGPAAAWVCRICQPAGRLPRRSRASRLGLPYSGALMLSLQAQRTR